MNTYTPENRMGWWGELDTRLRCSVDDKVAFDSQERAEHSALKVRNNPQRESNKLMQAYKGKCGNWHVGHSKSK